MNENNLLLLIIGLPAVFALLALVVPAGRKNVHPLIAMAGFTVNLVLAIVLLGKEISFTLPWLGGGMDFSLKLYNFNGFIVLAAAGFSFLVTLYTTAFAKGKSYAKLFYVFLLLTIALVNGAVLANNLMVMLFFWEGILGTLFGLIYLGGEKSYKTSIKAVIISGVTDLCMMIGIGITAYLANTLTIDQINLPLGGEVLAEGAAAGPAGGWYIVAFVLLLIGAISKAGSMPFHTWIPDAADDAPMPFLAFLPGTLEKLLGIYLTTRICMDMFQFNGESVLSLVIMIIGGATIIFGVMMALIQKDFKRLLSYHAISQVGYMLLGIGTATPIGIVGGLFHMLNHAVYKCCLFLTAGSVEKQTGTTDLKKISGLGRKMPITFICFLVAAASIAGFPMTNGFFSKEMIFDGALERGTIFYIVALVGAFFTSVSFLKLGHAAFLGKPSKEVEKVKEAPVPMLISMIVLAVSCLALGVGRFPVIRSFFEPVLAFTAGGIEHAEHLGEHTNWMLVIISVAVMALAFLDHWIGFKKTGKGLEAADHIHYAPGLHTIYGWAEKKYFDPYFVLGYLGNGYAVAMLWLNNGISWVYDEGIPRCAGAFSKAVKWAHNGSQSRYVVWSLVGTALIAAIYLLTV
jgi:NADH-quinone oxidoreductase subunit L